MTSKTMKTLKRVGIALCLIVLSLALIIFWKARSDGFFRQPVYDYERPTITQPLKHPAILVFNKTNGFIHREAIPAAADMYRRLGRRQGWDVYVSGNAAIHNPEDLGRFDVVVWNNVSGDVLTTEQRSALKGYIENGGGFVALHASSGDYAYDWQWYPDELIRARFIGHPMFPHFQRATVKVNDPEDAITAELPDEFLMTEEWYSFARPPEKVKVLLSLDETSYSPRLAFVDISMGADHPIAWKHCLGRGRVVYSSIGHNASTYADPWYMRFLEKATQWAAVPDEGACRD